MQDPTTNERQTTDAPAPHDGDIIRYERPDWMSSEQWAEVKQAALAQIHEEVATLADPPWCVMATQHPADPHEVHVSATVKLSGYQEDDEGDIVAGWRGWLRQDRGKDEPVWFTLESKDVDGQLDTTQLRATCASMVLAAVHEDEAYDAVVDLFAQVSS